MFLMHAKGGEMGYNLEGFSRLIPNNLLCLNPASLPPFLYECMHECMYACKW